MRMFTVITGMHRSGTSYLAKKMHEDGLRMGTICTRESTANPAGQYEHIELAQLSEALLESNGGSWDRPPEGLIVDGGQADRATEIVSGIDGYKNPRAMLTLDPWSEAFADCDIAIAGIFRHPLKVAESLHTRNEFSYQKSLDLWATYNGRLLDVLDDHGGTLTDFDATPDTPFKRSDFTYDREYRITDDVLALHDDLLARAA